MNSICIICSEYPNRITPTSQVFVQQFVWAMAERGVECTVICPLAINLNPSFITVPYKTTETTDSGAVVKLYFPKFISFGQRLLAGLKTARATTDLFHKAVLQVWKELPARPDIVYGHFLTPPGICASRISKKYGIPAFAAYGESSPWSVFKFGKEKMKKEIANLTGIVAVSNANKEALKALNLFPIKRIRTFPNGVRSNFFYPRNKIQSRKRFGIDPGTFLVAFLGGYSERKGVLRVAKAVDGLKGVSVAFAGKGPLQPKVANCVFNNVVQHEDIPFFLSAADVFVLPTLNEGCCNAIVEAVACGLPVVSSDLPFNADILDRENSILIDPKHIEDIKSAIMYLRDNPAVCTSMSRASLEKAKNFGIDKRAMNILSWIREVVETPSIVSLAE